MSTRSSQHGAVWALLLATAALSVACSKPQARLCPSGIYCPAGSDCAARSKVCIWTPCGNGRLDPGEACDDGNLDDKDGCSKDCKSTEVCGNGITDRQVGEVCDDGNTDSGDGCSGDCLSIEACGNGSPDPGEDCDGGEGTELHRAKETPVCTPLCKWSVCGDGYTNVSAHEQCDGGDPSAPGRRETAECNSDCTLSKCGDGKTNESAGEECDDGARNGVNARCLPTCKLNVCGDRFRDATREQCDDGPANADSGTDFSGACLPGCVQAKCGDGHVRAVEEDCDTGPDSALDEHACPYGLTSCQVCNKCKTVTETTRLTGYCGDGHTNGPEQCDEGTDASKVDHNGSTTCAYSVERKECTHCNTTCSAKDVVGTGPYCGDRIKNGPEACDDGPDNGLAYCPGGTRCKPVCNSTCTGTTQPGYCGDPFKQDGEACDEGSDLTQVDHNGSTVCKYGVASCLHCNTTCSAKDVAGTGPYCGDGQKTGGEACDDSEVEGDRLVSYNGGKYCLGGAQCQRVCNDSCKGWNGAWSWNGASPMWCGDGTKNGPEACDGQHTFSCGTCSDANADSPCQLIPAAPAKGSIEIKGLASLAGVTITLQAGGTTNPTMSYTFLGSADQDPRHIDISSLTSAAQAAAALAAAVNKETGFAITATSTGAVVSLTNWVGGKGNTGVIVNSSSGDVSAVSVTSLTGGNGCAVGVACDFDNDCVSSHCRDHQCTSK